MKINRLLIYSTKCNIRKVFCINDTREIQNVSRHEDVNNGFIFLPFMTSEQRKRIPTLDQLDPS